MHGFTLSQEQVAFNEANNGFNVEFRDFIKTDYRSEHYDKIYLIVTWVAERSIFPLMQKLTEIVNWGGRLVLLRRNESDCRCMQSWDTDFFPIRLR